MKLPNRTTTLAAAGAVCNSSHHLALTPYQERISSMGSRIIMPRPRVLQPIRFYIIDTLSPVLQEESMLKHSLSHDTELKRVDLDLGADRFAFYVDHVLSADESDALAACAEAVLQENGHSRMAPGIMTPPGMRVNEAAHWFPPYNSHFLKILWERIRPVVPSTLDGLPLYDKLSEKVAQFRYNQGDRFNPHVDGLFPGQGANPQGTGVEEWMGVVSGMSMLFYLNDNATDGLVGGETRLWTADQSRFIDVTPRKGRVLFFRRGSPNAVLHAGLEVKGDVPKYMALINLAYGHCTGTRPLKS